MAVQLIAHALIKQADNYLLIKRSLVKRGELNAYPEYWDIPGGTALLNESPRQTAIRETLEEVGQKIYVSDILHEDSNLDGDTLYTRLVYRGHIERTRSIVLDPEEHTEFRWICDLSDMKGEKIVPYLEELFAQLP
ncbi:NUDIX hydrolase [Streptococcus massiliensis]|uniref:NTP pyrophosphohydrolases including oxidative damage repair enzymes n=1 Tax=Streptococcus massiliensis TaxID=313439 RepID=A0A380L0A4_9STRE|nr:NUDIX hydrolase [Streptococcus massiliensis]SUN77449.1 NTP pyrophosphohydrolases including oxidative damage repair enzymes [Streptococcus massiliensis]